MMEIIFELAIYIYKQVRVIKRGNFKFKLMLVIRCQQHVVLPQAELEDLIKSVPLILPVHYAHLYNK